MPSSCSSREHARCLGPRLIRQPDPAKWARACSEGHGSSGCVFGLAKLGVKLRDAKTSFVDVTMAAQMILDRVDAAQGSQPRNRSVIVGDGHIEAQAAGVPGDRLAEHMASSVTQSGGDPQNLRFICMSRRADHLDDIRLSERQSPGLVKRNGSQAADLFEKFTAPN